MTKPTSAINTSEPLTNPLKRSIMAKSDFTPEILKQFLHYDPDTGLFTWIKLHGRRAKIGDIAGTKTTNGRIGIGFMGHRCYAHRLAWFYIHGHWPTTGIDHIDGDPSNNRLSNLREANQVENMQNIPRISKISKSGLTGAFWITSKKKWTSSIMINSKLIILGYFPTAELAHAAYCEAKAKHHTFNPVLRN
jgi:hypothetical protein